MTAPLAAGRSLLAATRPRFLGTVDLSGWRFKSYWASQDGRPRPALLAQARLHAAGALPDRPDRVGAYGVGFMIVEASPSRLLAQVSWWVRPDELYQRSFAAPGVTDSLDEPLMLAPAVTPTVGGSCELAVTAHEAGAWLRHVLANPAGPDIDAYLADVSTGTP
jgi:hypothetical protein